MPGSRKLISGLKRFPWTKLLSKERLQSLPLDPHGRIYICKFIFLLNLSSSRFVSLTKYYVQCFVLNISYTSADFLQFCTLHGFCRFCGFCLRNACTSGHYTKDELFSTFFTLNSLMATEQRVIEKIG